MKEIYTQLWQSRNTAISTFLRHQSEGNLHTTLTYIPSYRGSPFRVNVQVLSHGLIRSDHIISRAVVTEACLRSPYPSSCTAYTAGYYHIITSPSMTVKASSREKRAAVGQQQQAAAHSHSEPCHCPHPPSRSSSCCCSPWLLVPGHALTRRRAPSSASSQGSHGTAALPRRRGGIIMTRLLTAARGKASPAVEAAG